MEDDHRWFKVLPSVLLCAGLWGSAFPCIKTVYRLWAESGLEVGLSEYWWFAGIRFSLAGAMLWAVARRPGEEVKATSKRALLGFTLTQTFGQYLLFYYAMSIASGSLAGLLSAAGSFWWMVLAPLLAGAPRPSRRQWLAILLGGVGISLATAAPGAGAGRPVLGAALMIGATGLGAVGIIQFGKIRATIGARAATGFSLGLGGLMLLAAGGASFPRAAELMTLPVIVLTCWLAFVSASAFGLWNHLSTRHPVPLLAGYRFLIPIFGMVESLVFLKDEKAGWGLVTGAVIVIGSLILGQKWK